MKVAAFQALLSATTCVRDALQLIRECVETSEEEGISILCCPEAMLGGLADYLERPQEFAIPTDELATVLAPLSSESVTSIVGFTELGRGGELYNAAAILTQGRVAGIYRKLHPAIRQSVYAPGCTSPVFRMAGLTFGILICNDSNFPEPAKRMAAEGATVLFVPTNNALPKPRASSELVMETRQADRARAIENRVWVIRADVAGESNGLLSYGSSGVVNPDGMVKEEAQLLSTGLLVAEVESKKRTAALPFHFCNRIPHV